MFHFRRISLRPRRTVYRPTRLKFEALEERRMLSVTVQQDPNNSSHYIVNGDTRNNDIILTQPASGDVNADGIVNGQDIAMISSNWLGLGPAGDANYDGIVNGEDIALASSNWLQSSMINVLDGSTLVGTIPLSSATSISVNGGDGDDTIEVDGNIARNLVIDGGTGANTLRIFSNNARSDSLDIGSSSATLFDGTHTAAFSNIGSLDINMSSVGAANSVTVEGTSGNDNISANGSTVSLNGLPIALTQVEALDIKGNNGDDTINGSLASTAIALTLDGGDGNDVLTGGSGNDTLLGGTGNDTYIFQAGIGLSSANDVVTDSPGATQFNAMPPNAMIPLNVPAAFTLANPSSSGLHFSFALQESQLASSYSGASASNTGSLTFSAPGTQTLWGRVYDSSGNYSTFESTVTVLPNDPLFGQQWDLQNTGQTINGSVGTPHADINVAPAWTHGTGTGQAIVAVIDTGVQYEQPDISPNLWTNPGESGTDASGTNKQTNKADDDQNGYIDDVHGATVYEFSTDGGATVQIFNPGDPTDPADFVGGVSLADGAEGGPDSQDHFSEAYHGTQVASTIAASGNDGLGMTGVDMHGNILSVDALLPGFVGDGYIDDSIAAAINYIVYMKTQENVNVRVINMSIGGGQSNANLLTAIENANAAGILFVAAAGNDGINVSNNPPLVDDLYGLTNANGVSLVPNLITVAATTNQDQLTSFSDYSATKVALAAPGQDMVVATTPTDPNINSTLNAEADPSHLLTAQQQPYANYTTDSGTSFAAPLVAGAAELLFDTFPQATMLQVRDAILNGVDDLSSLAGKTVTGGRLDVNNSETILGQIAPTAVNDVALPNGTSPVMINVLSNDTDLGNSALLVPSTVQVGVLPSHGTVSINSTTGAVTYTPGAGFNGSDQFTYTVENQWGTASNVATVTIGARSGPTFAPIPTLGVTQGAVATFQAAATDPSVPGATLTFGLGAGAPAGATIDPVTGQFSWQAPASVTAPYQAFQIPITVTDNGNPQLSAYAYVTVNVLTRPGPTLQPLPTFSIYANSNVSFQAIATDALPNATLTFGLGVGAPAGATIDPVTGQFSWHVPSTTIAYQVFQIPITVTDNGHPPCSTQGYLTVNVTARPAPILGQLPTLSVNAGSTASFTATATDPADPGATLTFSLGAGAPAGATINPTTGQFSWTVPDSSTTPYQVPITVTDNGSPPESATGYVTINSANVAPILSVATSLQYAGITNGVATYLVPRNQAVPFTLNVAEPALGDAAAGYTFVINWNDVIGGSDVQTVSGLNGTVVNHVFAINQALPITFQVFDHHGATASAIQMRPAVGFSYHADTYNTVGTTTDPSLPLTTYYDGSAGFDNVLAITGTYAGTASAIPTTTFIIYAENGVSLGAGIQFQFIASAANSRVVLNGEGGNNSLTVTSSPYYSRYGVGGPGGSATFFNYDSSGDLFQTPGLRLQQAVLIGGGMGNNTLTAIGAGSAVIYGSLVGDGTGLQGGNNVITADYGFYTIFGNFGGSGGKGGNNQITVGDNSGIDEGSYFLNNLGTYIYGNDGGDGAEGGNNTITASNGAYQIFGNDGGSGAGVQSGNNTITTGNGSSTIYGNAGFGDGGEGGNNYIQVGNGNNEITGNFAGRLDSKGSTGSNIIIVGNGNNNILTGTGYGDGNEGSDVVIMGTGYDLVGGHLGADAFIGGGSGSPIAGLGGNDLYLPSFAVGGPIANPTGPQSIAETAQVAMALLNAWNTSGQLYATMPDGTTYWLGPSTFLGWEGPFPPSTQPASPSSPPPSAVLGAFENVGALLYPALSNLPVWSGNEYAYALNSAAELTYVNSTYTEIPVSMGFAVTSRTS